MPGNSCSSALSLNPLTCGVDRRRAPGARVHFYLRAECRRSRACRVGFWWRCPPSNAYGRPPGAVEFKLSRASPPMGTSRGTMSSWTRCRRFQLPAPRILRRREGPDPRPRGRRRGSPGAATGICVGTSSVPGTMPRGKRRPQHSARPRTRPVEPDRAVLRSEVRS